MWRRACAAWICGPLTTADSIEPTLRYLMKHLRSAIGVASFVDGVALTIAASKAKPGGALVLVTDDLI